MRITVVVLIYLALTMLISIGFLVPQLNSKKSYPGRLFIFFMDIGLSLALYFFMPSVSVEIVWIASIPPVIFWYIILFSSGERLSPRYFLPEFFCSFYLLRYCIYSENIT